MPFPKNLLADHEKVVFELRPHWIEVVPSALWAVVVLVAWIVGYQLAQDLGDPSQDRVQNIIAIVALIAIYFFAVLPFLRWRFTYFVLTSDRLITRNGIIAKHSKEIPLERINDVAFGQTVIDRFLGAGDLMIESAGERGQTRISNVRKPETVQLMIYKEAEHNNNRMMLPDERLAGTTERKRGQSIPEQIEALARLKEQGAISDLEFENKKQELLKRM